MGPSCIYPLVTKDYQLKPVKPVLMAEGAYEAGSEYGFDVTPLWVRRQAYYSYLAGAHHTYGHNDSWRVLPTWKSALDAPGAQQMGILRKVFEARAEWWLLVPDQSVFAAGGQTEGRSLHLAARHQGGKWVMIYLADKAEFSVDLSKLSGAKVRGFWCNPQSGERDADRAADEQGSESVLDARRLGGCAPDSGNGIEAVQKWRDALRRVRFVRNCGHDEAWPSIETAC